MTAFVTLSFDPSSCGLPRYSTGRGPREFWNVHVYPTLGLQQPPIRWASFNCQRWPMRPRRNSRAWARYIRERNSSCWRSRERKLAAGATTKSMIFDVESCVDFHVSLFSRFWYQDTPRLLLLGDYMSKITCFVRHGWSDADDRQDGWESGGREDIWGGEKWKTVTLCLPFVWK